MTRCAILLLLCLTTWPSTSAAVDGRWNGAGPDGGRIGSIIAGSTPGVMLINTLAGVYRSIDYGVTWASAHDGLGSRIAGGNENTLVAANGIVYSVGAACTMLYRSVDDGASWLPTGFDGSACIDSIAITAGTTPRVLIYLRDGALLASDDHGATFAAVGGGLPAIRRMGSLSASPGTPGLVLANVSASGTSNVYRSTDSGGTWTPTTMIPTSIILVNGTFSFAPNGRVYLAERQLYRSDDNGSTWGALTGSNQVVAAHPGDLDTVYFVGDDGHLKRSISAGNLPQDVSAGEIMANATDHAKIVDLVITPTAEGDDLVVTTEDAGVFRRSDGIWTQSNNGIHAVNVRAIAAHPFDAGHVVTGSADGSSPTRGIYRSTDFGATWTVSAMNPRALSVRSITIDPTTASTPLSTVIYATGRGVFESTEPVNAGLWKSSDGGTRWSDIQAGIPQASPGAPLGTVRGLALDLRSCASPPPAPTPCTVGPLSTVYATSDGVFGIGSFRIIKSVDGGSMWTDVDGLPPRLQSNGSVQTVTPSPIVIDPHDSATLYVGSYASLSGGGVASIANGMFRSTDGGASWALRSTGLPLRAGSTQTHFNVYALAIDSRMPDTLWASTIEPGSPGIPSRVYKTLDGGAQWQASSDGITGGDIRQLVVADATPGTLYAAALGSAAAPGGVYRSRDGGATWRSISAGLHEAGALALAIDPLDPARLYAGTAAGVFVLEQRADADLDGIPDAFETSGPNGGDGNADGLADATQANVATFARSTAGRWVRDGAALPGGSTEYITVAVEAGMAGTCTQLVDAQAVVADDRPADGTGTAQVDHALPLVRFEVLDCPTAAVLVTHHGATFGTDSRFRFYGPSLPALDDLRWRAFDQRATRIDAQSWRLQLDAGAFGSYRPGATGSILFEGGLGSDRLFATGFE